METPSSALSRPKLHSRRRQQTLVVASTATSYDLNLHVLSHSSGTDTGEVKLLSFFKVDLHVVARWTYCVHLWWLHTESVHGHSNKEQFSAPPQAVGQNTFALHDGKVISMAPVTLHPTPQGCAHLAATAPAESQLPFGSVLEHIPSSLSIPVYLQAQVRAHIIGQKRDVLHTKR